SAAMGIIGLETAIPLGLTHLVGAGKLTLSQFIERSSIAPRRLLGLRPASISIGEPANLTMFDPAKNGGSRNRIFAPNRIIPPFWAQNSLAKYSVSFRTGKPISCKLD